MRPLVAVRRATPFASWRLSRSATMWPLRGAIERLGPLDAFPSCGALVRVFAGAPPVRFEPAHPRPRRRETAIDATALYDGRIALEHAVPTREGCWHDLMNALVWGTFPRAKLALHARQHRAVSARVAAGDRTLPPTRTRELDALALLDEGGVVVLADDPDAVARALRDRTASLAALQAGGTCEAVAFGHAIHESLALGVAPAAVAAVVLPRGPQERDRLARVDDAVALALADGARFQSPEAMCRVDVSQLTAPRDYLPTQTLTGIACS